MDVTKYFVQDSVDRDVRKKNKYRIYLIIHKFAKRDSYYLLLAYECSFQYDH